MPARSLELLCFLGSLSSSGCRGIGRAVRGGGSCPHQAWPVPDGSGQIQQPHHRAPLVQCIHRADRLNNTWCTSNYFLLEEMIETYFRKITTFCLLYFCLSFFSLMGPVSINRRSLHMSSLFWAPFLQPRLPRWNPGAVRAWAPIHHLACWREDELSLILSLVLSLSTSGLTFSFWLAYCPRGPVAPARGSAHGVECNLVVQGRLLITALIWLCLGGDRYPAFPYL